MYIGPFFFDTKELFLILAAFALGVILWLELPLWWFDARLLLTLCVLFLLIKGLLPATHNEAFFFLAVITLILSVFTPPIIVLLGFCVSFICFKLFKVI